MLIPGRHTKMPVPRNPYANFCLVGDDRHTKMPLPLDPYANFHAFRCRKAYESKISFQSLCLPYPESSSKWHTKLLPPHDFDASLRFFHPRKAYESKISFKSLCFPHTKQLPPRPLPRALQIAFTRGSIFSSPAALISRCASACT